MRFLYFCLINTVSSLFLYYLCFVSSVAIVVFGGISILSLLLVNFDRYLAIEFPLKYPYFMSSRRAGIAIAFSWTSAFGTSLLSLLLSIKHIFRKDSQYPACETLPRFNTGVVIAFSVGLMFYFIIPLAITIAIYIRIIVIVKRHQTADRNLHANLPAQECSYRKGDRKALNTFLLVTVISSFTWLPQYGYTYYSYADGNYSSMYVELFVHAIFVEQ